MEILRLAQVVLDMETDSFSDELLSVRLSVERCLSGAAEDVRRKYDSLNNLEASRILAVANADPSVARFRQVCRRFFLTSSGYAAAEKLVALWLDAGEYGLAARLAGQILAEPAHHSRITPQFRRVAASLASRGFRKGEVLGILSANTPEYAIMFHGVALLGGVVTPINPLYTEHEIGHQLKDAGARFLARQ